jgi:hypothetical protein
MMLDTGPDCLHAILLEHQGLWAPPGQATAFQVGLLSFVCIACVNAAPLAPRLGLGGYGSLVT